MDNTSNPTVIPSYVTLPAEDFREMQSAAYADQTPLTTHDRIAGTIQATALMGAVGAAVGLGAWGIAKASNYFEEKSFRRRMIEKGLMKDKDNTCPETPQTDN